MEIDPKTIIVIAFDEQDQIAISYDDLSDFDYFRGLVCGEFNRSAIKLSDTPPIYQFKLKYGSSDGLTSEIFKILHKMIRNECFCVYETILENVLYHCMKLDIDGLDGIAQSMLLNYVKTSQNTDIILYILKNTEFTFSTELFNIIMKLFKDDDVKEIFQNYDIFVNDIFSNKYLDLTKYTKSIVHERNNENNMLVWNVSKYNKGTRGATSNTKNVFKYCVTLNKSATTNVSTCNIIITSANTISKVHIFEINTNLLLNEYDYDLSQYYGEEYNIDKIFIPQKECTHMIFVAVPRPTMNEEVVQ